MRLEAHKNIVVIGASAGGVKALPSLLEGFPADFEGAIFVAMHLAPWYRSQLPELINRRCALRARYPLHGDRFEQGALYLAPPDNHLMVRDGYVQVLRGPKENGHRPSVDALFRSASKTYGPRVVGVVLTGALDCGTAGLVGVKARGGTAIVQSPEDAEVPEMPASAIRHVAVDYVLPLSEIAKQITSLASQDASPWPEGDDPDIARLEGEVPGTLVGLACPICQDALSEARAKNFELYRCHVGHTFTPSCLALEQAEEVDRSLWAAVRALEESAALARRLADKSVGDLRATYLEREETDHRNAGVLRRLMLAPSGVHPLLGDVPAQGERL